MISLKDVNKCGMKKTISRSKFLRVHRLLHATGYAPRPVCLTTSAVSWADDGRLAKQVSDFYHAGFLYRREQDLAKPEPDCFSYYRYDLRRLQ